MLSAAAAAEKFVEDPKRLRITQYNPTSALSYNPYCRDVAAACSSRELPAHRVTYICFLSIYMLSLRPYMEHCCSFFYVPPAGAADFEEVIRMIVGDIRCRYGMLPLNVLIQTRVVSYAYAAAATVSLHAALCIRKHNGGYS